MLAVVTKRNQHLGDVTRASNESLTRSTLKKSPKSKETHSENSIRPSLIPLAISFPTWWGNRLAIISFLAHRSSTSGPVEAPQNKLNLIFPCKPCSSTCWARAAGTIFGYPTPVNLSQRTKVWWAFEEVERKVGVRSLEWLRVGTWTYPDQPRYWPSLNSSTRLSAVLILFK